MSTATAHAPASAGEAMAMVHAGLAYMATADATAMSAEERARCLRELEQADAVATAARTSVLAVFGAAQDYTEDGDYSPRSWLIHRTQVSSAAAADHTGWVRRGAGHPAVMAALATREVSRSYAREICRWTDKLPEGSRAAADEILLSAAASGLELEDLAGLAAEMYERSRQDTPDADSGDGCDGDGDGPAARFDDRSVTLATTLGGAGIIRGNLTPECAAFIQTVLDTLSAPAGADDDRTHEQRYHDGLAEAMRRLVAAGLAPRQGGQPVRVWAYISLADLLQLDGGTELAAEWVARLAARWAGHRAAAEAGGHQGLWLDGAAARGIACGAPVTPVVVGNIDPAAIDDLIRLCAQLDKLLHGPGEDQPGKLLNASEEDQPSQDQPAGDQPSQDQPAGDQPSQDQPADDQPGQEHPGQDNPGQDNPGGHGDPAADAEADAGRAAAGGAGSVLSREALVQAVIGKAVELLSGPGGLASFLRRELGLRAGGPSLPLDIGYSETVPASIRNAVRLRDKHCQWAGGCTQPAAACQVHHTRHKANGGPTSLKGCVLLCDYHHQVMIHRRGWTLVVNPDGTTTAWNKNRTKVLHSHGPPARAGPSAAG